MDYEPNKPCCEREETIDVTYKFKLPYHSHELDIFSKAEEFSSCLWDIYRECRSVWKYQEDVSPDKLHFAEMIGQMIGETGLLDE